MNKNKSTPIISISLISISVVVALWSNLGKNIDSISWLFFSNFPDTTFEEIKRGEIWRLVTPVFIHFGIPHILFNSMALLDLGKVFEANKKSTFLILFIYITSLVGNLFQYIAVGPLFGGLSGLIYGMFGYSLIVGNFGRQSEFKLETAEIVIMLGWYALCWTDFIGPIANWAHTGGLLTGVVWGLLDNLGVNQPSGSKNKTSGLIFGSIVALVFLAVIIKPLINGLHQNTPSVADVLSVEEPKVLFEWSAEHGSKNPQYNTAGISSVQIGNKLLKIEDPSGDSFYKKIKVGSDVIENDIITIEAAYPNENNPDFLIVSTATMGTCCPWQNIFIIRKDNNSVDLIDVPTTDVTEITVDKDKAGSLNFHVKFKSGVDKAGDDVFDYMDMGATDKVFLKRDVRERYPELGSVYYPSDLFENKALRSAVFNLRDEDIGEIRSKIGMQIPIKWTDGTALMMCSVEQKGEWGTSQIIVVDLMSGGFEIQRFVDSRLDSIKGGGNKIRQSIREHFSYDGECWKSKYQNTQPAN